MAAAALPGGAGTPTASEYEIKAAFLYNFAKFIDWPAETLPDTSASITLCILGEDPFGDDLEQTINDNLVNGRAIMIKRLKGVSPLNGCHILFISSSERYRLSELLAALKGSSLLTVGETERFTKLGGIIRFTMEENKVRFEINVDAAEHAGLKISSRLLKLAKVIQEKAAP